MTYVVYLTFYSGNKMPPFYIGSTLESRIHKGYNGSVESKKYKAIWRQERRDNPHLFNTRILQQFNTDLEALAREEFLHRFFDVPNNPMFINQSRANGKFGGSGINHSQFGTKPSKDTSKKRSQSLKGNKNALGAKRSDSFRKQVSEKLKGRPSHRKGKHLSDEHKNNIKTSSIGRKRGPYKPRQLPLKKRACVKRGPYKKKGV